MVLDALTPPVHPDGEPAYLSREVDFYQGDTRNRDLLANLLRRVDAVYHFAAYQDYLPDFSRFSDVNVVSTALLYEIIVAERLDLARVVVASSQSAMGEGLYWCPADGEQTPGMRPESALAASQWDIPCPECGGPLEMRATPERVSNPQNAYGMSKLAEEMVAVNLGRRYGIPTVARQRPVHRRPSRYRPGPPGRQLEDQPPGTPPRVGAAQLAQQCLHLGGHPLRAGQRPPRPVSQPGGPVSLIPGLPAVHRLPGGPIPGRDLRDRRPAPHLQHRLQTMLPQPSLVL